MNNLKKLLFFLLILIYTAGVLAGAVKEVRASNQPEMYKYLEDGVKAYDTAAASGVKSAAKENLKFFSLLIAGCLFKPLVWLLGAAMLIKGYVAGFSVMASLRLYGIKGVLLCISNLASAAVLIPAASYYGSINAKSLLLGEEKHAYYRRFFAVTIFLGAIFCADAFIKGASSPIFIKWASKFLI
ncbi:MAG: hypothetical protein IK072_03605 [Clostridia bacterium]|nr:hypothetical protein [Clostridia bacterium]